MPIKPIDLQQLFMQMSEIKREQALAKEGAAVQQAVQGAALLKRQAEEAKSVKGTEEFKDDLQGVRERPGSAPKRESEEKRDDGKEEKTPEEEFEVIRDPDLGGTIDISG